MAISLLHLLSLLAAKLHLHCDWKPDQVGVVVHPSLSDQKLKGTPFETGPGSLKLIDYKSLRRYAAEGAGRGVDSGQNCSVDADCLSASHCLVWAAQHSHPVPDHTCGKGGKCVGIDASSLLLLTNSAFLTPLLLFHDPTVAREAPAYLGELRSILGEISVKSTPRRDRPTAAEIAAKLTHAVSRAGLTLTSPSDVAAAWSTLERVLEIHVAEAEERCRHNEYC
jgi:hypothetical protein